MKKKLWLAIAAAGLTGLSACNQGDDAATGKAASVTENASVASFDPSADTIKRYMTYLASDELEGRETGQPGFTKAARFVVGELKRLGLEPAGENGGYYQNIQFIRGYRKANKSRITALTDNGQHIEFENNVDYAVFGSDSSTHDTINAPVVFVGYGIVAPENGRDDFAGVDVQGKIVAVFNDLPTGMNSDISAFYGGQQAVEAAKRGAVGFVSLETPTSQALYPFARLINESSLEEASMSWISPDGKVFDSAPGLKVGASISMAGATKLFEDAPMSWLDTVKAWQNGNAISFELPVRLEMTQESTLDDVASDNIVAIIAGSDPVLKNELIVLVAHLDHIGVTKDGEGDLINNGALDNAGGVASLLEAGRMLLNGPRPKRSIVLLISTAEEKGLMGSRYFAKNPTVEGANIVGVVNLDMPVLTYPFEDLIVFGGTRSTIESAVKVAVQEMGLVVSPDPFPEQGAFVRSDHYSFVQEGVPAIMLATGMANGGDKAWEDHFSRTYHRPADDMNNALDFDAAAKFAEVNTRIALELANANERPLWNKNDFFARQYNGPMK